MYDTWGAFTLLCEKYLIICNLPKISQNGPGLKELKINSIFSVVNFFYLPNTCCLIPCREECNGRGRVLINKQRTNSVLCFYDTSMNHSCFIDKSTMVLQYCVLKLHKIYIYIYIVICHTQID